MANEEVEETVDTPIVDQGEAAKAEVEAREDAALAELDPVEDEMEATDPEPGPEHEPDEVEEAGEAGEAEGAEAPDLADAYTVLRRDGFQPDDLEALDDEVILRLAEHRKKSQGDVDRLLRESKEGSAEGEDEQTQEESDTGSQQAEATSDQPSEVYLQEAVKPIAEYLGLDEEGSGLLAKSYEAVVAPLAQELQDLRMQNLMNEVERARAGLVEAYPQVADGESDNIQRVVSRMSKLWSPESSQTTSDLMEEAITLEFRDELSKEAKSAKKTITRYKRNGLPDSPKRQRKPDKSLSQEEREDAILNLLDGDSPDRMQRARELGGR